MEYLAYFAKLLILVCLVSEAIQGTIGIDIAPRIVGGRTAASGQFPYQVSVRVGGKHTCGGTIISEDFVVTAAHCVYSVAPAYLTILAGTTNRTADRVIKDVVKVIPHPNITANFDNDIALLKLNASLQLSDLIQPITLAALEAPVGSQITISGWGRTNEGDPLSSQLLYNKFVTTISDADCTRAIGYDTSKSGILCLSRGYGNGICDGDEGGPAVYRGTLIGIASFQIGYCGSGVADGYSKVKFFRDWLIENSATDTVPV
ncbi:serine protease SP24D-like [Anastrepha obliqua]|uniref:serine protease SP24D-like n=1 Tax=Anastrepha obliqua TaxID=95512 RepID=UPI00240A2F0A|nr:serine protease SP24D-like [Anastrepha obliqua]